MQQGGWSLGPSIALELDTAMGLLTMELAECHSDPIELPDELRAVLQRVPAEWREEGRELVGQARRWMSLLAPMASLAGVLREGEYSRATLAIRSMTLPEALERAAALGEPLGLEPDGSLPLAERLADLTARLGVATVEELGLDLAHRKAMTATYQREMLHATRVLRDGDLHTRFWHWLDRGYYEIYRPWRDQQAEAMREQEERALLALGSPVGDTPPPLGWLAQQNALMMLSQVGEAVEAGRIRVHFWVQPFHLFDFWHLAEPGLVLVSFAEPGNFFEGFRQDAEAVASRAKAIADPTRLMILRLIRHFSMDNTQIADYLGIARPTVSIHAKLLREAGLIDTIQEGRQARHTIKAAAVRRLFRDLDSFLDLPDEGPE